MRARVKILEIAAVAIFAISIAGCPKETAAPSGGGGLASGGGGSSEGGGGSRQFKIAVIPKGTQASFWQSVKAGAEAAGNEEHVLIDWQGPNKEGDIMDQVNLVQTKITGKVDGIVLAACDAESLIKPAKDAASKGIPVVTIDSGLKDPDASLSYIATDNVEGGRKAAEQLAKEIGEKGKVGLMIFHKGAASSDDREKGFLEGINKYPNIKLVSTLEANDPAIAIDQVTNMLTANPDIVGIFAANEPNGIGAAQVLKQKKLGGKIKLVAYDSSPDEIKALEDGLIQATVVQDPFQMGYKGVKTVLKAIRKQPIGDKFINSGMTVVTKANLNTPEVQKLVNPTPGK